MRPVEAREGLHGLNARKPPVHVHAAQERPVEARLKLVRYQQNLELIAREGIPDVAPRKRGFSPGLASVSGSAADSLSSTSPENATRVPIR